MTWVEIELKGIAWVEGDPDEALSTVAEKLTSALPLLEETHALEMSNSPRSESYLKCSECDKPTPWPELTAYNAGDEYRPDWQPLCQTCAEED
jgi:hypothetical protein